MQAEPDYPEILGLTRRFYQFNAANKPTHHVSLARIHDNGWFIQELAGGSDRTLSAIPFILSTLSQLKSESRHWTRTPRFLFGAYDPNSKFNQSLWGERSRNQSYRAYRIPQHSLASSAEPVQGQLKVLPLETTPAGRKRRLYEYVPERILDATGLLQFGSISPLVNSRLSKLGRHYGSNLYGIQDEDNKTLGFVHRYSAPFTLNVTGVLNAVQVFTSARLLGSRTIVSTIRQLLQSNRDLILGTPDILVIDMDEDLKLEAISHQIFRYMILDLNEVEL